MLSGGGAKQTLEKGLYRVRVPSKQTNKHIGHERLVRQKRTANEQPGEWDASSTVPSTTRSRKESAFHARCWPVALDVLVLVFDL